MRFAAQIGFCRLPKRMKSSLTGGVIMCCVLAAVVSSASANTKIPIPLPRPHFVSETGTPPPLPSATTAGPRLSLADAVFMGLRGNRAIKSAYVDRIAQKFDLRVVEDRFAPQFSIVGEAARQRIGQITSTTIDVSPGVSVQTKTGAVFDFAWTNSAYIDRQDHALESVAEISISQPLLRGAGVDVNMAPVLQARLGERINRLRLKATLSETVGSIIFAHRDLFLAQEEWRLAQDAVARGEDLLNINRALIGSGRMPAMDAVQTEAYVESQRLRVLQAKQQVETARLALLNLLDLDLGTKIVAVESSALRRVAPKVDDLLPVALTQRPDYQGQLEVVEQTRLGITVAKNEQLWDISLFARGRFGGVFSSSAPTQSVADIVGGVRFTIPINDLSQQQQLVQAGTNYRSAELQLAEIRAGVEMQIRDSATEVDLLWQQLAVAKRSRDLAAQAIKIEKAKLNVGRSTTFQVRSLEDSLRTTENQLLMVQVGYLNGLTRLDLQLGTTLDTWKITLKD